MSCVNDAIEMPNVDENEATADLVHVLSLSQIGGTKAELREEEILQESLTPGSPEPEVYYVWQVTVFDTTCHIQLREKRIELIPTALEPTRLCCSLIDDRFCQSDVESASGSYKGLLSAINSLFRQLEGYSKAFDLQRLALHIDFANKREAVNRLVSASVEALNASLTHIEVEDCQMSKSVIVPIQEAIAEHCPNVRFIKISHAAIDCTHRIMQHMDNVYLEGPVIAPIRMYHPLVKREPIIYPWTGLALKHPAFDQASETKQAEPGVARLAPEVFLPRLKTLCIWEGWTDSDAAEGNDTLLHTCPVQHPLALAIRESFSRITTLIAQIGGHQNDFGFLLRMHELKVLHLRVAKLTKWATEIVLPPNLSTLSLEFQNLAKIKVNQGNSDNTGRTVEVKPFLIRGSARLKCLMLTSYAGPRSIFQALNFFSQEILATVTTLAISYIMQGTLDYLSSFLHPFFPRLQHFYLSDDYSLCIDFLE